MRAHSLAPGSSLRAPIDQPATSSIARSLLLDHSRGRRRASSQRVAVADFFRGVPAAAESAKPAMPAMDKSTYNKTPIGDALAKSYDSYMPKSDVRRRAGIILHPTSLPVRAQRLAASAPRSEGDRDRCMQGPYGIGELGGEARAFVDWLVKAGMTCWQMLPLGPPDPMFFSPYSGTDANCGNPLMISIDELIKEGLLDAHDAPKQVSCHTSCNLMHLTRGERRSQEELASHVPPPRAGPRAQRGFPCGGRR